MVTTHAADMLQMTDTIGTLGIGRRAVVSVLKLAKGDFTLEDKSGASMPTDTLFMPVFALRAGTLHAVDSPLLPERERRLAA
jgi:dihydroorotase